MVCHVDFSVEAIQLSSPPLSDSDIDKKAQLLWERGDRPQRTHLYRFIQLAIFSHHENFIPNNSLTYEDQ